MAGALGCPGGEALQQARVGGLGGGALYGRQRRAVVAAGEPGQARGEGQQPEGGGGEAGAQHAKRLRSSVRLSSDRIASMRSMAFLRGAPVWRAMISSFFIECSQPTSSVTVSW